MESFLYYNVSTLSQDYWSDRPSLRQAAFRPTCNYDQLEDIMLTDYANVSLRVCYTPAILFLYSANACSNRSRAEVSPGTLWEGCICSFTPRLARISATVVMVIQTAVTKAIVETGPILS